MKKMRKKTAKRKRKRNSSRRIKRKNLKKKIQLLLSKKMKALQKLQPFWTVYVTSLVKCPVISKVKKTKRPKVTRMQT